MADDIRHDYGSPRWSQEITDCAFPMTFDTYSVCAYDCVYCFSQYQRGLGGAKKAYFDKLIRSVNVEKVKCMFTDCASSEFGPFIESGRGFQWGGLSDQFDDFEREHGVTLELLQFFARLERKVPITFSTKATWWAYDERYRACFKGQPWNVKVSIITLDEGKASRIERGVPSSEERLAAMKEISNFAEAGATLRLRPFIIGVSSPRHEELIERAAAAGATAVSTEFFCLEQRSPRLRDKGLAILSQEAGFDLSAFYRKFSTGAGYLRLSRGVKKQFMDEMKAACDRTGLRFYVSDPHFKEMCHNGACCGLPETFPYARGQWTEALQIAKRKGEVAWADIEPNLDYAKFPWHSAAGFNTGGAEDRAKNRAFSMKDWLHYLWNHPNSGRSPYKMFGGVLVADRVDEAGDVVYRWNKEVGGGNGA